MRKCAGDVRSCTRGGGFWLDRIDAKVRFAAPSGLVSDCRGVKIGVSHGKVKA